MRIALITLPYHVDGWDQGTEKGPEALLRAGLVARLKGLGHTVSGPFPVELSAGEQESYGDWNRIALANARLARLVATARQQRQFPLLLESNCYAAIGALAGLQAGTGKQAPSIGMVWIDAHGDCNTPETTLSGMLSGMPVAMATGQCLHRLRQQAGLEPAIDPRDVVMVCVRANDPLEQELIDRLGIENIPTSDIQGECRRFRAAVDALGRRVDWIYLHVDIDALDASEVASMWLSEPGGPSRHDMARALESVMQHPKIAVFGLSDINPDEDVENCMVDAALAVIQGAVIGLDKRGADLQSDPNAAGSEATMPDNKLERQNTCSSKHPLELSRDEMRRFGYRVIETIVEHFAHIREQPAVCFENRMAMESRLREAIPQTGMELERLLEEVRTNVLELNSCLDHPRFFAYVPGPNNFVSVMADALAGGFNVFAGSWLESPGAAMLELITIEWLRQLFGLSEEAGGLFVSGGSHANLSALAVARAVRLGTHNDKARVYCSDQTHSSIQRATKSLGFHPHQLVTLTANVHQRLDVRELARQVDQDRRDGYQPFCVVANAGTTNTGAVDSLTKLAALCQEQGLWLHADAAYGGGAILSEEGRRLLQGIEQVDSLSIDPHKWLFQPYEIGCLLVRRALWLEQTFKVVSDYGKDEELGELHVNFCDRGMQLTRRFNALKLWMSLKAFGLDAFRQAVERGLHNARIAETALAACSAFEIVTPAQLGVITFRHLGSRSLPLPAINELQRRLVSACVEQGYAMLTTTELGGKVVLRMCLINPATTEWDVRETISRLKDIGDGLGKKV